MNIKQSTLEDCAVLAALAEEIWTEHYTPLIGNSQVTYMLENFQSTQSIAKQMTDDAYLYFIAYADDEPCGYCAVKWEDETNTIFLSKLYVKQTHRKKGAAKALLQSFVSAYPDYEKIYLTVNKNNEASISAYKSIGFEISDSVISDIGNGFVMDDFIMSLKRKS